MKSELSTRLERQELLQSPRKQSRYADSHGKMSEQLFKNAHGISSACFTDGTANHHFPAENALDCRVLHIRLKIFPVGGGGDPLKPRSRKECTLTHCQPCIRTQTPINFLSAWISSVRIVPVLQDDHCCEVSHPLYGALSQQGLYPIKQTSQYASTPDNRSECYAELAVSSPVVAKTTAGTHCTYPRRDGKAEWA